MRGWLSIPKILALAGILAASMGLPKPVLAQTTDLAGIWEVDGFTHAYGAFRFFVRVERQGDIWVATKLNSSRYVPTGNTHLTGTVSGDRLQARVQVAFPGFNRPEWKEHTFSLVRDSDSRVTQIRLVSGDTHVSGAEGEQSIHDNWVYRRWPAGQFRLLAPKIEDYGYRSAQSIHRSDLRTVEDSLERWKSSQKRAEERFDRARQDHGRKLGISLARQAAYEKAWDEAVRAKARIGRDEPVDTARLPSRLRNLYRMIESEKASIKRAEQIILDHQDGTAPQSPQTIATLFSGIDSSRANIARLERIVADVRRELGLPPERDPATGQREAAEAAKRSFDATVEPYTQAQLAERMAATEMDLARGQIELARSEIEKLEIRKRDLEAKIKGLEDRGHLVRIEGFASGDPEKIVYQAVPSGLDEDLRGLRDVLTKTYDLMKKAEAERARLRESFKRKFDEGTRLRDEVRDLIWDNALEMAAAHATTKTLEFGVAFATGGPAGLAIEMVSTPIFQNAFYESRGDINGPTDIITNGGVIFQNYDETNLRNAYRQALRDSTAGEPDPADACRDLNVRIRAQIKAQVFNATEMNRDVDRGFRSASASGAGGSNQRIQSTAGHYTLQTMGLVEKELVGELATHLNILQRGYLEAEQAAAARVAARVSLSGQQQALQELAELDARIASQTATQAERTAAANARSALLNRLAANAPELAEQIGRNSGEITRQLARLTRLQNLAAAGSGASAGERTAAQAAIQRIVSRIGSEQAATRSALQQAASHINWGRTLAHQTDLAANLTRELGKLAKFEQTVARLGLRNSVKGSAVSVATSLFFSVANDLNQSRLQAQEKALWERIFRAEIEQSLRLKAWQRATCIYWAVYDQYFELQRFYSKLYQAYDPETGFELKQTEPVRDYESLDVRLIYEPLKVHRLQVRVGRTACPETVQNGCRVPAGGLSGETGPYLPVDVVLHPRE